MRINRILVVACERENTESKLKIKNSIIELHIYPLETLSLAVHITTRYPYPAVWSTEAIKRRIVIQRVENPSKLATLDAFAHTEKAPHYSTSKRLE